jgi:hypothetical protein
MIADAFAGSAAGVSPSSGRGGRFPLSLER